MRDRLLVLALGLPLISWLGGCGEGQKGKPIRQTIDGLVVSTDGEAPDGRAGDAGPVDAPVVDAPVPDAPVMDGPISVPAAGRGVLTHHNDNQRTGANLGETVLTPALVGSGGFGKLYCQDVDDQIYAQLLYVPGIEVAGKGKRNVVVVATVNNSVYAFDADARAAEAAPLWQANYNVGGETPYTNQDASATSACGGKYTDATGNMGIMGTPVIDADSATVYFVTRTKAGSQHSQRLHAISLLDGRPRAGSPTTITASLPGMGWGQENGLVPFLPLTQNQRAALLLHGGAVFIAWASHCDQYPYHGWLIAYDAKTLEQVGVFNTTVDNGAGGIWMSGAGPAVDADGFVYLTTGNGAVDPAMQHWGNAALKLRHAGGKITVEDYFIPDSWKRLNGLDLDLGSSGVLLIPGTKYMTTGGKDGRLLLLDRSNLGKMAAGDAQIPQWIQVSTTGHIHGAPVHWKSEAGDFIYVMAEEDFLKQYKLEGSRLGQYRTSAFMAPDDIGGITMPGGTLSISANGARDGVLWINMNILMDASPKTVPGVLRAFDASDVTTEIWNSERTPRDSFGNYAKYNPPTVYNGRVYVPTFSNRYCVYGKLP